MFDEAGRGVTQRLPKACFCNLAMGVLQNPLWILGILSVVESINRLAGYMTVISQPQNGNSLE